jgi:hypothetical protein
VSQKCGQALQATGDWRHRRHRRLSPEDHLHELQSILRIVSAAADRLWTVIAVCRSLWGRYECLGKNKSRTKTNCGGYRVLE